MFRRSYVRTLPPLAALLTLLAVVAPLAADVLVLKDGSTIQIKGGYKIEKGKALFTLLNGTRSIMDADKIDVQKTDAANKNHYGSATILDQGASIASNAKPILKQTTLSDLINSRGTNPRDLPSAKPQAKELTGVAMTKTGFPDLNAVPRRPLSSPEVAVELLQFLRGQGLAEAQVWAGTQSNRVLVEVQTGSETQVFQALNTGANALLQVHDRHPQVGALELLMLTPAGDKGGQFVLTPDMAADLVAKRTDLVSFYVRYVQF
ncbi:MAG TPA: hypothetical protein VGE98_04680 [Thermoanaerobaculia bacterium]